MAGRLAAHPRSWRAAWYGGVAALGFGLVLALDGRWAAAIPLFVLAALLLWLTGSWALPRSQGSYRRRVTRTLSDWTAYANWLDRPFSATRRLAAITPPERLRAHHDRFLALADGADAIWNDESLPLPERARRRTATRLSARELLATVRWPEYVAEIERIRAAQLEEYEAVAADADRAATAAIRRLESITPPPDAAHDHRELTAALRAHLEATRALRAAELPLDPERAAAAAAAWEAATAKIEHHTQRLA